MSKIKDNYNSISKIVNGYRIFSVFISLCSFVTIIILGILIYTVSQNKIMVVDGEGDILSASKTTEASVFKIEADNHIRLFYSRFFSYDKTNYKNRVESGLLLSGKSAVNLYETLNIKGWYDKVVNNDLIIESYVQSIQFFEDKKNIGLSFNAKGFQKVMRGSFIEIRNLDIKGNISKHPSGRVMEINPHGLIIDNIAVLDNSVVKTEQ